MLTIKAINHAKRILAANKIHETRFQSPVRLPATLYDKAKAQGIDMTGYVKQERIE
jgi:hypothetical protein